MGAPDGDKGELVGIADGEYIDRLSLEFTVRLPIVTLPDVDNKCTPGLEAHALRANRP